MTKHTLPELRQSIDKVDKNIYKLLCERAELAKAVAVVKQQANDPTYYRPEREADLLRNIMQNNQSAIDDHSIAQIFRQIMSACLALQKPLSIAFLGPEGTFSQLAVQKHFGHSVALKPQVSIERVFREVISKQAHYGIVPIENSTEGVVNSTLDALMESSLLICGEVEIPIHHQLLRARQADDKLANIKQVYAHPQSLGQCRHWLDQHLPNCERIAVASNALAAQTVVGQTDSAAIASSLAAETYDLNICVSNIEDNPQNTTRFLIIGQQAPEPSQADKTSVLISTPHSAGALAQLLQPFAKHQISMSLIESRPYRHHNWHYLFFIDFEGHQKDPKVQQALEELGQMSVMLNILGSYPRAAL